MGEAGRLGGEEVGLEFRGERSGAGQHGPVRVEVGVDLVQHVHVPRLQGAAGLRDQRGGPPPGREPLGHVAQGTQLEPGSPRGIADQGLEQSPREVGGLGEGHLHRSVHARPLQPDLGQLAQHGPRAQSRVGDRERGLQQVGGPWVPDNRGHRFPGLRPHLERRRGRLGQVVLLRGAPDRGRVQHEQVEPPL